LDTALTSYHSTFILASIASTLLVSQGAASPTPAKTPGGKVTPGSTKGPSVISFKGLFPKYFPSETDCCEGWGDDCRIWTREDADWMVCGIPGDYEITQSDADAMKCLSYLHWSTPFTCIDVKPNACGYGAGLISGEITSAHIWNDLLGGSSKAGPLSMDVDRTVQAGVDAMVGEKFKTRNHNSIVVVKRNRSAPLAFGAGLEYFGQKGRSC
jgi:hypothetical protein